jgi:hypothetical protein
MLVQNLINNNGNTVPNQFLINDDLGRVFFQSYKSIIIKIEDGQIYLDDYYWDYSVTTGKYRNQVLCENIKETRQKIKSGEYKLIDLNGGK